MYGINGAMSVLGSVIVAIVSMLLGITTTFYIGLSLYATVLVLMFFLF